jgi:hypothetical protein
VREPAAPHDDPDEPPLPGEPGFGVGPVSYLVLLNSVQTLVFRAPQLKVEASAAVYVLSLSVLSRDPPLLVPVEGVIQLPRSRGRLLVASLLRYYVESSADIFCSQVLFTDLIS